MRVIFPENFPYVESWNTDIWHIFQKLFMVHGGEKNEQIVYDLLFCFIISEERKKLFFIFLRDFF